MLSGDDHDLRNLAPNLVNYEFSCFLRTLPEFQTWRTVFTSFAVGKNK